MNQLRSIANKKPTFVYLYDPFTYDQKTANFNGFKKGDLDKIDIINYSFGKIANGKLNLTRLGHPQEIITEAHEHGVRVVLAIGGWGAGGFSEAAESKDARQILITSIIEGIKKYQFDGIDLDWEYPTSSVGGITANPKDKHNFTALLKELKEAMDDYDKDLILSCAVAAGEHAAAKYYEVDKINQYIDYLHIMTYDLIDYKTLNTTHHTNLYDSSFSHLSSVTGVDAYLSRGIDKNKIVIGVAFYGQIFTTQSDGENNGINVPTTSRGTVSYEKIVNKYLSNNAFVKHFDEQAQASWLYGENTFITYDEPKSIAAKCRYVKENDLGGVMVWEYCKDDENSSLVNAIYENMK